VDGTLIGEPRIARDLNPSAIAGSVPAPKTISMTDPRTATSRPGFCSKVNVLATADTLWRWLFRGARIDRKGERAALIWLSTSVNKAAPCRSSGVNNTAASDRAAVN
jgi:hypothetical protein